MGMVKPTILVDPLSAQSLFLETYFNEYKLSQATGFFITKNNRNYLITNFHVLSGRDPETLKPIHPSAGIPNLIRILHHHGPNLGHWKFETYPLVDKNNDPLWLSHPTLKAIDVLALPLDIVDSDTQIFPLDLNLADTDLVPVPAMPVSIIGFPMGMAAGGAWPIWKTGHIATDPDIDYDGRPSFLIDATTREGMSGSPVVIRLNGGYKTKNGSMILAGGITTKFLGIYSGRIKADSEIGRVWRPNLIGEIIR